jgi:hypothetical protein
MATDAKIIKSSAKASIVKEEARAIIIARGGGGGGGGGVADPANVMYRNIDNNIAVGQGFGAAFNSAMAEMIYVPWASGYDQALIYAGGTNAGNNIPAIIGESYSDSGVVGTTRTGFGLYGETLGSGFAGRLLVSEPSGKGLSLAYGTNLTVAGDGVPTANLLEIRSPAALRYYINPNMRLHGDGGIWVTNSFLAPLGEQLGDYSLTGMYDRSETYHAALKFVVTATIINPGSAFFRTTAGVNLGTTLTSATAAHRTELEKLFDGIPGQYFEIDDLSAASTPSVEIVIDCRANLPNYAFAQWQHYLQYRSASLANLNAGWFKGVKFEVGQGTTLPATWYTNVAWATTDYKTSMQVPAFWVTAGGLANSPASLPGNVFRWIKITLTDFQLGASGTTNDRVWISQVGTRHVSAPWTKDLVHVAGDTLYGALAFTNPGTTDSAGNIDPTTGTWTLKGLPSQTAANINVTDSSNNTVFDVVPGGLLRNIVRDTATNAVATSAVFDHESSASTTTGFGVRTLYRAKWVSTANQDIAEARAVWTSGAAKNSDYIIAVEVAGTMTDRFRVVSDGTLQFGGQTFQAIASAAVLGGIKVGTGLAIDGAGVLSVTGGGGGGMTDPMTTAGDIIIRNGSNVTARLAAGTNTHVLTMTAGVPAWAAPVTGFANPMTTAGDIIVATAGGAAQRLAKGANNTVLGVDGSGNVGYQPAAASTPADMLIRRAIFGG